MGTSLFLSEDPPSGNTSRPAATQNNTFPPHLCSCLPPGSFLQSEAATTDTPSEKTSLMATHGDQSRSSVTGQEKTENLGKEID
jgi:hypothetical protein